MPPEAETKTATFHDSWPANQLAWDSTSLGEFITCPRKYQYRILWGFVPQLLSPHLKFGLIYHKALETYDHSRAGGQDHQQAVLAALRCALGQTWDHRLNRPWASDIPEKTRLTLVRTVIWYLARFEEDVLETVILANGKPAVELSFRFESGLTSGLSGLPYLLCGHLDRLCTLNGKPWILDRKTTKGTLDEKYIAAYSPDNQMTLYNIAGEIVITSSVKGIIIDAAQVGAGFARFQRFFVHHTRGQQAEWLQDLEYWLLFSETCASTNYWPMNRKSCSNYGGCPYRQVCSQDPSQRKNLLNGLYKVEKWDPLITRGDI
jgi:hypothetical protein